MPLLDPANNRFLKLGSNVIRTDITDPVIAKLDKYFNQFEHHAVVTSILRTAEDQMRIIYDYAIQHDIDDTWPLCYSNPDDKCIYRGKEYYVWQHVWSQLLNKGVIINPPLKAEVLFDYWRYGINKKGMMINPSRHFHGDVFDIGGQGGIKPTVTDEVEVISYAISHDPNLGIEKFIIERTNNALHIVVKS